MPVCISIIVKRVQNAAAAEIRFDRILFMVVFSFGLITENKNLLHINMHSQSSIKWTESCASSCVVNVEAFTNRNKYQAKFVSK